MEKRLSILKYEEGASFAFAEYSVLVALIAMGILLAAQLLGMNLNEIFKYKAG